MYKNNKILACFLGIASLTSFYSCDKNLDINISKELEVNYFGNEYRITQGIGAAYAEITNIYSADLSNQSKQGFWLLPADDITSDGTGNSLETFSGLNGDNNSVRMMWITLYKVIARCNFMLEKLDGTTLDAVYKTPGLKDANKAEMLFIRSWCNFKLWDNWRKAPLQDSRINSVSGANLPPSKDFELLDNAIASLEEAAPLAYKTWNNLNKGRITQDACYGLLVKLYVTRACYNSKSQDDYSKAIEAYGKISPEHIEAFKGIVYGDNFDYRTENNDESLFEFQASIEPSGQDNAWLDNDFGGDVGQMAAFYHYGDAHWANYSSGVFGPTQKLMDAFDPEDPRKSETFKGDNVENYGWSYWWINPYWGKFGNHQLVKYTNGDRGKVLDPMWQIGSNNNPRLLRLADVKLCVAEAYLSTGNTGAALIQINDVRERARNSVSPESTAPAALSSVAMSDIMKERMLELAGEDGHRWSDLKRWHAAGYINLANWTASDFGFSAEYDPNLFKFEVPKNLLYPIPTAELDRNPLMAASGQNPGY
jgi:starch-binding outer membrane protein, SusD/RagB family